MVSIIFDSLNRYGLIMINLWLSKNYITGGNIYSNMVFDVLHTKGFNIDKKYAYTPYQGRGASYIDTLYTYFFRTSQINDIDIMEYNTFTRCSRSYKGKKIVTLFHYDVSESPRKIKRRFFFNRFKKLSKDASMVVISNYWKDFLLSMDIDDVTVIHCGYETEKYKPYISKQDLFTSFGLPDKPIIYLGKNSTSKTLEAYRLLKPLESDYLIVTTGPRTDFHGPVHLNMDFKTYVSFLHYCSVVVLLPQFDEGWSRIAHESIICGSPVIGNGRGGMRELLEGCNQIIVDDNDTQNILKLVDEVVSSGVRVGEKDHLHAKSFNIERFGDQWEMLINKFL